MQKQVPFWLSSIIIVVALVSSAFVIAGLHMNTNSPESEDKNTETMQPAYVNPYTYVAMPNRPPQYLNKEQKDQLTKEVSDLFLYSDEIIFDYRESKNVELKSIIIDNRSALKLFSENFKFDSDVSYSRGLPTSPVFTYFKFMPSGRSLIFDSCIAERKIRVFNQAQQVNYYGMVSHDFLLFCQYYFSEIIDQYGEFNMVDKTRLYTYPENQNAFIEEKLTGFSSVVSPYHVTDGH